MGAKKTGVTDQENGKELYVSLSKLEEPNEGERASREKITVELFLEEDLKVTLLNRDRKELYSTIVKAEEHSAGQYLRIVIANAIIGGYYYLQTENTKGEYKKEVYLESRK